MDWVALGGATVSALLALYAIVLQRRDRKIDRADSARDVAGASARADRAQQAADEAAAAALRSAAATERMAQAMEAQSLAAARAAPAPQVSWQLAHNAGDTYLLTNAGNAVAYDVAVDTGDMIVRDTAWPRAAIQPDEAAKILAARSLATRDDTVTVTWADAPGSFDRRSWSRPLPPSPRRARLIV